MGNASKRLAHEVLIAGALMLGSCMKNPPGPDTGELAKAANSNSRMALAKCQDLERRVTVIESRLSGRP